MSRPCLWIDCDKIERNARAVVELCARHGIGVTGVHMHIGSGTDLEHLAQVCAAMESAAMTVGRSVRSISAGGFQRSGHAGNRASYHAGRRVGL